jgi:hypothetical protein
MSEPAFRPIVAESDPPGSGEEISISMDKRIDLGLSLIVAATGAYICYLAANFRVGSFPDPVTSRGLPYVTGGVMIAAGLTHALRRLLTWNLMPGNYTVGEGKLDDPGHPGSAIRAFGIIACAFAWVLLVRPLGYLIVTPPMFVGMLLLMNIRSKTMVLAFAFGFTAVVWIIFSQFLKIILPLGPLTALFRSWGLTP